MRMAPPRAASPLTALPLPLVRHIFSLSLKHPDHRALDELHDVIPRELKTLALVSLEWNAYAHDVASEHVLRKLMLKDELHLSTRRDLVELRRVVTLYRRFISELEIKQTEYGRTTRPLATFNEGHWRSVLSLTPQMETLQLQYAKRYHVTSWAALVRTARAQCPCLGAVKLPPPKESVFEQNREPPQVSQQLVDAATATITSPPGQVLRQVSLPLPFVRFSEPHIAARNYINRICDLFPSVELLNGYESLLRQDNQLTCGEQWHIDPFTWERFCATCTRLKKFDWVVVPFATRFFEVFSRYPKPQLEKLVLSTAMNWDWDRYYTDLNLSRSALGGYGAAAANIHVVLESCPALKELEAACYLPGEGEEDEDEEDYMYGMMGGFGARHDRFPIPDEPMLNQELFGDEFCEAVACCCRNLEKFTVWRVMETAGGSIRYNAIMNFTDRAMRALASLPRLRWAEIKSVNITGDGLFSLAACYAPVTDQPMRQREFVITVGDGKGSSTQMRFYEVVERFLQRLAESQPDELICASRHVAVRMHNGCFEHVEPAWSEEYLARVRSLALQVIAKHRTVRVRILTRGFKPKTETEGDRFREVVEFGFYTEGVELNMRWGWENEPQDTRIDAVVLNRGPLETVRSTNMRYDDEDEDDDEDESDGDINYDDYGYGEYGEYGDDDEDMGGDEYEGPL